MSNDNEKLSTPSPLHVLHPGQLCGSFPKTKLLYLVLKEIPYIPRDYVCTDIYFYR